MKNPYTREHLYQFFTGVQIRKQIFHTSEIIIMRIEEFRIIGFYLYHVTSIRPSNSMGASGSLTASLNIEYDWGSSSYYC